jgi:primosomal protein N' (replication factor Y)
MSCVNNPDNRAGHLFDLDADGPFAGVVLNRPVDEVWTYRVPERLRAAVRPGCRVRIPLGRGNKPAVGYCVRIDNEIDPRSMLDPGRVKDIIEVLDDPPLIDRGMLDLTEWLAGYYACSWGQALDAVVPAGVRKGAGTRLTTCVVVPEEQRALPDPPDLSPKQAAVMAILRRSVEPLSIEDTRRLARCATGPIAALRERGLVHTVKKRQARPVAEADAAPIDEKRPITLTDEQIVVLDRLAPDLDAPRFGAYLLHGVTGSGKTEVYLSAIERVVARGREAIVLVPEISLTPQTIRRFRRRFPRVAVLHSHLSDAERHRHWTAIAAGEVQVVVGARSAVFAPCRKLGLIVIDEEHESTFKQETAPRYHARDVAVKRAQMLGVPVLLGTATPALESWRNAEVGRYTRLVLGRRVLDRPMPPVEIIDQRHEKPTLGNPVGGLTGRLRMAMREALDDGGQVILLLNRRGFHTFILCPRCGHVLKCDACDIALTHHKGRRVAICHTCDAEREPPASCPSCQLPGLHYGGIGTERLEREVREGFPDAVIRRMDSDTMRAPGSHEQVLRAFKAGEVQILLGTQMIAKGLDFPNVTLVGVISADTALHLPDFRAAERTFQLVAQVAGRTGRGDRPGRVIVQTFSPDAPSILCAARHDYLGFAAGEIPERQKHGLPPFSRLVRLVARGPDEAATLRFLVELGRILRATADNEVRLRGPAPAPVARIKNLFRFHLQLQAGSPRTLQALLRKVLPATAMPSGIELAVDVDPLSLL